MTSLHVSQLESILKFTTSANEPQLRSALDRIHGELQNRSCLSSPESTDFFTSALHSLSRMKGTGHAAVRMMCLHKICAYFYCRGNHSAALNAAHLHDSLAAGIGCDSEVRLARNLKGVIHADLGNISEALVFYSQALDIARNLNDIPGECSVLNNIGIALNYSGLYREAIPYLQRAVQLAPSDNELRVEVSALSNLAQSQLHLEELPAAFETIQRCISLSVEPTDAVSRLGRTVREFSYVRIALAIGETELARERAELCRKYGFAANMNRTRIMAQIAVAICEVRFGNVEHGLVALEQALVEGRPIEPCYTDALVALVQAYDEAGRPEQALECMGQLIDHIKQVRFNAVQRLLALPTHLMFDPRVLSTSVDLRSIEHQHALLRAKVAERAAVASRIEMFERLAVTADLREDASGEHGYRVGKMASLLAAEIGCSAESASAMDLASRLHDIGKIGVPDRILGSSDALRKAERHFMGMHTIIGAELLAESHIPQLRMAEEIARYHHEWWNGTGYPDKLAGKRIPIHARIVALADVFDALTHGRPFAQPWPVERALQEIRDGRGTQFDPDLTDRFVNLVKRLQAEHPDLDAYLGRAGRNSPFLQARNRIRTLIAGEREMANTLSFVAGKHHH